VTPHRGLFHCFGCGVAGDAIGFLVRYDDVSFLDAVRMLSVRVGVELDEASPRPPRRPDEDVCGRKSWQ
jgi:DNA primase